jgi:hypothetical protein
VSCCSMKKVNENRDPERLKVNQMNCPGSRSVNRLLDSGLLHWKGVEISMPHLIGIVGPLGAGKTTGASIFPWLWKNIVEGQGGDLSLFSNFSLFGSHPMDRAEDWYKVAEAHGSVCVWDEAHRTFDSRKFSAFENIFATELLTYVRKLASIQVFATPSINRLDTRIREILEILIVVRKVGHGTFYDFYDFQADFGGRYGRYMHSKFLPKHKITAIHKLNLFDTYSFVSKFPLPKSETEAVKFMNELEAAHMRGLNRRRMEVNIEHVALSS